MKKFRIFLFVAFPLFAYPNNSSKQELLKAISKINILFDGLKTISKEKSGSKVSQIKIDLLENFFISDEQDAPNEFNYLEFNNDYKKDVSVRRYIMFFNEMFLGSNYKDYSFDYEVMTNQSHLARGPELQINEAPANFAQVVVRKTYKRGYKVIRVFSDTLQLNMELMKVCKWANDISTSHIIGSDEELLSIEQMRINAAIAYDRKEYSKAYQIYTKLVKNYPNEGDPYYRMAVMLYKKDAGRDLDKKSRGKMVLEYLNKAIKYGGYNTQKCAENMYYWITC